jgi:hypothetical protein
MSNTTEKDARSFCEKRGGRVEERIGIGGEKNLVCAFDSTLTYDSGVELEDNYEYDLFDYYDGNIENHDILDEKQEREQKTTLMGKLVIASVDAIMSSITRTLYTNSKYCVDIECLYAVDCSFYMKQVLKRLPKEYYDALPKSSESGNTVLAKDYYNFFKACRIEPKAGDLWQKVENITKVKRGDIIAYKYIDSGHSTTGHVMVAYSTATKSTAECKKPEGYVNQHWLWVSDSANSGHREDTRDNEGPYASSFKYTAFSTTSPGRGSGVGIGKMWFNTGSKPFFRWSKVCGKANTEIKIAIGRPIKNCEVPAAIAWSGSGIDINVGDQVELRYSGGKWQVSPETGGVDASGKEGCTATSGYTLPGKNEGLLCGRIGSDGPVFPVGNKYAFTADKKGELYFCANDDLTGQYGAGFADNEGSVHVIVDIIPSQPV